MNKLNLTLLMALLMASQINAQTVSLDNGFARMDLSLSGGKITRMSLNAIDLNPIHEYGHFICFDRWGPSSTADQALGIPWHGNGSKVTWTLLNDHSNYAEMSCLLPIVKLSMNRKVYLSQQSSVFKVVEEITNHNDGPKVYNLVQHPTIGAPFLDESTIVDTQADSGFSQAGPLPPSPADVFKWPETKLDGDSTDMRYLSKDHSWSSAVVSFILDEKKEYRWVTAVNPSLNLMVGYLWPSADYPWLNLWWNLKNAAPYARGLEFGSTGLHQTWPEVLAMDSIFGKQLYTELEAGEKEVKSYYAFLSKIPSDYRGVESVSLEGDIIQVEEYGADPERSIEFDIAGILKAEERVLLIDGGEDNGGSLETIINGDTTETGERIDPMRIYELKSGEVYLQHAPIKVNNPEGTLTIRGQEGGAKPVIIRQASDETIIEQNQVNSNLTIQNVQYQGKQSNGLMGAILWQILGDNHHLRVEDCLFEFVSIYLFDMSVWSGAEIVLRNNYFRDLNDFSQWWGGRVVSCKAPVDTFIFENNSVSGGGLTVMGQECLYDYSVINHNTFINNHKYPFVNQFWKEIYFTNNLWVNTNMIGEDMENVVVGGSDPHAELRGISGMDSIRHTLWIQGKYLNKDSTALTSDIDDFTDIIYYAADNVVTYSATLDAYYNGTPNDGIDGAPASYLTWGGAYGTWKVLNVPGMWSSPSSRARIAKYDNLIDENNSIYKMRTADLGLGTDPLPQDAADVFIQWNRVHWQVPDVELPTDYLPYYFGDYNPNTIPGVETENSTSGGITKISDLLEDFSYTANLVSKSDGLRIGALHWDDEAFNSELSISKIKNAYQRTLTAIEQPLAGSGPELTLSNYPNPFSSETVIAYSLPSGSHVRIEVFNLLGQPVRMLLNEYREKGKHQVSFSASGLPEGIYLCRISAGNLQEQQKMIIQKTE